ncbi:MAG TPA: glycosyltransferase family 2 protein [Clostridiales bacterium]|nr:glycosyltransferase family 2 protein [Clostridiales bacterium]
MKVSVIVPIYNTGKFLRECLDSLVKQIFDDYEIIIINDGSTDDSLEIAREYKASHENIRCYNNNKKGVSNARNLGFLKAKGDYIFFCDSDDYVDLSMLDKMYREITEAQAEVAVCNIYNVYDNGHKDIALSLPKEKILLNEDYQLTYKIINGTVFLANSAANKLYQREYLDSSNVFFEDTKKIYAEDACFNYLLYTTVNKICVIDEPLYYYRCKRNGSITNSYKPDLCNRMKYLLSTMIDTYSQLPQYEKLYPGIQNITYEFYIQLLYNEFKRNITYKEFKKIVIDKYFINILKGLNTAALSRNKKILYKLYFLKRYSLMYVFFMLRRGR